MDLETTGLDPVIHVPWEVAAILAEHTDNGQLIIRDTLEGIIRITDEQLAVATPIALEIGGFHARYHAASEYLSPGQAAARVERLTTRRPHLVGAVPSFDERRFGDLMLRCGTTPGWHYHPLDVEALVAGWLSAKFPARAFEFAQIKSDQLSAEVGVDPARYPRHTAMGDVRWALDQYAAVFALEVVSQ